MRFASSPNSARRPAAGCPRWSRGGRRPAARATWEPYTSTAELAGLADLARRLAKARDWALSDPKPYAAVWSKLIGLPEAVPLRWFGRAQYRTVAIDEAVIGDEQRTIDLYVRAGPIPKARAQGSAPDGAAEIFDAIIAGDEPAMR